ncbi:MAG: alpha/beta hydrolase [Firmicutes bacterium]|nr:alpha/beta hydrolase [Bacillota bacterium]
MVTTTNGIELYYEEDGQGTAMIFIHGLGENASSWRHQLAHFRKDYRVVAMDLRGHGQSGTSDECITMELFARDVLTLLDHLKIESAHFVGHSMGGLISQEIAAHHPERMLSMVLSDSAGYYPPPMGTTGLETRLKNIEKLTMEEMAEAIANVACRPNVPEDVKGEIRNLFAANRKEPYRQATIATLQADYREYHSQMSLPTLLMVGELDQTTPLSYAEFLNKAIRGSKVVIIPDAAHMTKLENPKDYNRLLAEFIKEVN